MQCITCSGVAKFKEELTAHHTFCDAECQRQFYFAPVDSGVFDTIGYSRDMVMKVVNTFDLTEEGLRGLLTMITVADKDAMKRVIDILYNGNPAEKLLGRPRDRILGALFIYAITGRYIKFIKGVIEVAPDYQPPEELFTKAMDASEEVLRKATPKKGDLEAEAKFKDEYNKYAAMAVVWDLLVDHYHNIPFKMAPKSNTYAASIIRSRLDKLKAYAIRMDDPTILKDAWNRGDAKPTLKDLLTAIAMKHFTIFRSLVERYFFDIIGAHPDNEKGKQIFQLMKAAIDTKDHMVVQELASYNLFYSDIYLTAKQRYELLLYAQQIMHAESDTYNKEQMLSWLKRY